MKCELMWHEEKCKNESIGKIEIRIHSNIFSGVFEIGNKDVSYQICQEHFDKAGIKEDKEITFIPLK